MKKKIALYVVELAQLGFEPNDLEKQQQSAIIRPYRHKLMYSTFFVLFSTRT